MLKTSLLKLSGLLTLGLVGQFLPAQAVTYNVSPTGATSFDASNPAAPLKWAVARSKAAEDPLTHDTIIFAPGVYTRSTVGATGRDDCLLDVPTNVTVKAQSTASGSRSILRGMRALRNNVMTYLPVSQFITIGTGSVNDEKRADIVIDGFEIESVDENGSYNGASGVTMQNDCRLIQVINNTIHDIGGGGIISFNWMSAQSAPGLGAVGGADYITIRGNRIYNCCRWFLGGGGASGISLLGLSNTGPTWEDGRTVHNFIQRNRIYDNRTDANSGGATSLTDNNGIIIDLAGGFGPNSTPNRTPARTLIENNVIYGNDGRGVHVFKSSNVLVRNNSCYQNLRLAKFVTEGELSAVFAKDVLFVNNVVYADGTNRALSGTNTNGFGTYAPDTNQGSVIFCYNAIGGVGDNAPTKFETGTSQYGNVRGVRDNSFNGPVGGDLINKVLADYTVAAQLIVDRGSSATNGFPNNENFAPNDFYGNPRPSGAQVDRGAFETSVEGGIKAPVPPTAISARAS